MTLAKDAPPGRDRGGYVVSVCRQRIEETRFAVEMLRH